MRKGQELRTIVDSLTNDELEFANLETGLHRMPVGRPPRRSCNQGVFVQT